MTRGRTNPQLPARDGVRIVPLGGLGEVGMNCLALESRGDILVVDCGVTFPQEQPGVDIAHANFAWLEERSGRVRGVVLTHGHEDHIGALPFLLATIPAPVWGPPYALALCRRRLEEHDPGFEPELHEMRPSESFSVGCFEIEPIRVTHSIADCVALAIRTCEGLIVHSGDFKIDPNPPDGLPLDEERLSDLGDEGVALLLSDSTNIDQQGHTRREADVAAQLEKHITAATGRVIVALFGSNIHRLTALASIAKRTERSLVLLGRSLRNHSEIATDLHIAGDLPAVRITPDEARSKPHDALLYLVTGTQGEPRAALSRLARGEHPDLELVENDLVLLSARVIPGCELQVAEVIDGLERQGLNVLTRRDDPKIHCSGHAAREEQQRLIELTRPRSFLPVHGTFHHLQRHASLAREVCGAETLVALNGDIVELLHGELRRIDHHPVGRVHRTRGALIPDRVLRERTLLVELGVATVSVIVDSAMRPIATPRVVCRGFVEATPTDDLLLDAADSVMQDLSRAENDDEDDVRDTACRSMKRFFHRRVGRKPLVNALVTVIHEGRSSRARSASS